MPLSTRSLTVLAAVALAAAPLAASPLGAQASGARTDAAPPTLDQLIRAEDARARTASDLAVLRAGATAPDASIRRFAVRGLGRLERAEVLDDLVRALRDEDASVRRAAADAVAQSVSRAHGVEGPVERAREALVARLAAERDTAVRGQLAESIGRMRVGDGEAPRVAETLAAHLPLRGAVRGLYFLTRQRAARGRIPEGVAAELQRLATTPSLPEDVRWAAAAARLASGEATPAEREALRRDPGGSVRALVATAESIRDPAPVVRHRAVSLAGCPALVGAAADPDPRVALAAVDALAKCGGDAAAVAALDASPEPRAVVSLAAIAPERARRRLPAIVASADPFVRVHAARAARVLADGATLRRLARDRDPNVASEAIDGLSGLIGHAGDSRYVAALRSDAYQLLMSAARALGDSGAPAATDPSATAALVAALDRVSARRSQTSRDARLALVEALGASVPRRWAADFDPVVAARVSELTGATAAPAPLPDAPVPTVEQLRAVGGATIEMADGGRIELRLFPLDAPTNVWRFVRLARDGYYDGLTFHRVVPFFVVQGGSPLANEYVGDALFTRDELGLENRRGTVGLSTRGRDTGDGQFYVNTVDNARLDHDYTVFAEVVSGMDVVDRMREGARIRRVVVH